ncbi:MAG: hypothetical protein K0Q49_585 [Haloplasmataceae bacterium]|jgi:hypothetical protein|nr:hypothetical protein [Haloplasmataceae bacterium]
MVLKGKVEGRKPIILTTLFSSFISFIGMFVGLLTKSVNTEEKKAEYIAGIVSDTVDEKTAEAMFNFIAGIFTYLLVISVILLVLATINLFLSIWFLNKNNKKKIGIFVYVFSIVHLLSFRIIESIMLYRQALKYIMPENVRNRK